MAVNARVSVLTVLLGLVAVSLLPAQVVTTAQIWGSVADSQGLAVQGARVTATNTETGEVFTAESNELGNYLLRALPIGQYTLAAEAPGFRRFVRKDIGLTSNQQARVDVALEVGAVNDSVTVSSQVSPVNTTTSTLDILVDSQRMVDLPLNGRNVITLSSLNPGVTRVSTGSNSDSQQSVNTNGNRISATNVMLDGASMYHAHRGAATFLPPPDAVQEVKVITSGVGAEYGRGASVLSSVTKGGTNEFHGSLWNYLRNNAMDARSFFAKSVPILKYNQPGATIGGPVRKNKAFFFFAYQRLQKTSDSLSTSAFPPTAAERAGDFSNTRGTKPNDPLNNGLPFPGGMIPLNRFDPVAVKLLNLLDLPNAAGGGYIAQISVPNTQNTYMWRADYDWTSKDRTSFRGFYTNPKYDQPFSDGSTIAHYGPSTLTDNSVNGNLSHIHTFTPSLMLNVRISYTATELLAVNLVPTTLADLGARFITGGGPGSLPRLDVTGRLSAHSVNDGRNYTDTGEGEMNMSWFKGRHEISFGASARKTRFYYGNSDRAYGNFTFDGSFTKNAMADFVLGDVASMWQQQYLNNDTRYLGYGFFFQDHLRLNSRFTVNLGLRWDVFNPWRAVGKMAASLVPGRQSVTFPQAPLGFLYDHDPDFPLQRDPVNPGPRIGFAWDVFGTGKTSVRGGYGITYDPVPGQESNKNAPPFSTDIQTSNVGPISDPQKFVYVPYGKPIDYKNYKFVTPVYIEGGFMGHPVVPYMQSLNLTLEHEIKSAMVQASYVGSLARHVFVGRMQNYSIYIPGQSTLQNEDARRIYAPNFSGIWGFSSDSSPVYHALQMQVNKRLSKGNTIMVAYSYQKAIDEVSTADAMSSWIGQNPNCRRCDRGLGDYDIRNRLVASWVWELPFLRQQTNLFSKVLGGWEFSGIATLQSGMPINITSGRDNSLLGVSADRPNVLGPAALDSGRATADRLNQYFNTAMFTANLPGQFGNVGRNTLIGPGKENFDLSLHKRFRFMERKALDVRWDTFNSLNHAQFSNPSGSQSSSSFGKITSAGDGRIMQVALRIEF
jgi:outer membrane receptor protein involved in Fe transport